MSPSHFAPPTVPRSDAELVVAFVERGDRAAFAAIYDRYADRLHDTAVSMLRDRDEAADAVQDVFVTAAQRLAQLRDPSRLRAWLFAILRNDVYRRTARRSRTRPVDPTSPGALEMAATADPNAEGDALIAAELADLVHAAAGGLDDRDRMVLQLSVRQGLAGAELAAALGVTPEQSHVLVHRMRERIERSLGAYVVARRGRRDCPDLAELLRTWNGTFDVLTRKRVARHIDQCVVCATSRRTFAVLPLLSATPVFAAPVALRDRVLERLDVLLADAASGAGGPRGAGESTTTIETGFDVDGFPIDDPTWAVDDDTRLDHLADGMNDGMTDVGFDVDAGSHGSDTARDGRPVGDERRGRRRAGWYAAAGIVLMALLATTVTTLVRRGDGGVTEIADAPGRSVAVTPGDVAPVTTPIGDAGSTTSDVAIAPPSSGDPAVETGSSGDPFVRPGNDAVPPPPTPAPPSPATVVTVPPTIPPAPPTTTRPRPTVPPTQPPTVPPTMPPTAPPTPPPTPPPTLPPTLPPTVPTTLPPTVPTTAPVAPPTVSVVRVVSSLICTWTTAPSLVVRVSGPVAIASVRVVWSGPTRGGSASMVSAGGGTYRASMGIPAVNGTWTWTATATDVEGRTGQASAPIVVSGC